MCAFCICCELYSGGLRQYDGLIIPRADIDAGWFEKVTRTITNLLFQPKIVKKQEAHYLALVEHLANFEVNLIEGNIVNENLMKCVNNTLCVFDQLYHQKIFYGDPTEPGKAKDETWLVKNLDEV